MPGDPRLLFRLTDSQQQEVERVVAAFEWGWTHANRPPLELYVPAGGRVRLAALVELIRVDFKYRTKAGDRPSVHEYLAKFPELATDEDVLAALAALRTSGDASPLADSHAKPAPHADANPHAEGEAPELPPAAPVLNIMTLDELRIEGSPPAPADRPAAASRVSFEVIAGPHEGTRFDFDRYESLLAGRGSAAQLRLNQDPHFSRHHFRLEINPPRCHLIDLESMNGTLVNGIRVHEAALKSGDVISGGKTKIRVSVVTADDDVPKEVPQPNPMTMAATPVATQIYVAGAQPVPDREPDFAAGGIPGYELQTEVGRGAMGIVYRALQKSSKQVVALKVMKSNVDPTKNRLRLFVREAGILSQLNHPQIIRFFEMGMTEQGAFFVATEFVETLRFAEVIAGQGLAFRVQTVASIACQVLDALSYAHQKGLVHRDIKPTNILLSRSSGTLTAKLADFGLAKNYEDAGFSDMTSEGELRGSPAYIAPEQIVNARYAKPPCDLYSLGVTLYNLLSGKFPYTWEHTAGLLRSILEDEPRPLPEVCVDVPSGFAAAVHRALEKDPEKRFASAEEMSQALRPYCGSTGRGY